MANLATHGVHSLLCVLTMSQGAHTTSVHATRLYRTRSLWYTLIFERSHWLWCRCGSNSWYNSLIYRSGHTNLTFFTYLAIQVLTQLDMQQLRWYAQWHCHVCCVISRASCISIQEWLISRQLYPKLMTVCLWRCWHCQKTATTRLEIRPWSNCQNDIRRYHRGASTDLLITQQGMFMFRQYGLSQRQLTSSRIRMPSRLLIELCCSTGKPDLTLINCTCPEYFDDINNAAQHICQMGISQNARPTLKCIFRSQNWLCAQI